MKRSIGRLGRTLLCLAAVAALFMLSGCEGRPSATECSLFLDGTPLDAGTVLDEEDDLQVIVTLDGEMVAQLPFSQAHTLRILQSDGAENTVSLTGTEVFMQSANCKGHDCVGMGAVTRDNLDTRAGGGFIICLPHRLSVEVRGV